MKFSTLTSAVVLNFLIVGTAVAMIEGDDSSNSSSNTAKVKQDTTNSANPNPSEKLDSKSVTPVLKTPPKVENVKETPKQVQQPPLKADSKVEETPKPVQQPALKADPKVEETQKPVQQPAQQQAKKPVQQPAVKVDPKVEETPKPVQQPPLKVDSNAEEKKGNTLTPPSGINEEDFLTQSYIAKDADPESFKAIMTFMKTPNDEVAKKKAEEARQKIMARAKQQAEEKQKEEQEKEKAQKEKVEKEEKQQQIPLVTPSEKQELSFFWRMLGYK